MGTKPKYVVDLNRQVGLGRHVPALHYYLFSAEGRVYRAYDQLEVPGGDISGFDFNAAQRADPVNSGRYTVKGGRFDHPVRRPAARDHRHRRPGEKSRNDRDRAVRPAIARNAAGRVVIAPGRAVELT